jgi:hypothetical protein
MKIKHLVSTDTVFNIGDVECRLWIGETDRGIRVQVVVQSIRPLDRVQDFIAEANGSLVRSTAPIGQLAWGDG